MRHTTSADVQSSPEGAGASAKGSRGGASRTPQSASTSFFIIQEPVISPSGTGASPSLPDRQSPQIQQQQQLSPSQSGARKKSRKKDRGGSSSPLSRDEDTRGARTLDTRLSPSPSSGAILQGVQEEGDFEGDDAHNMGAYRKSHKHATSPSSSSPALSILNRVGSAPDLPLHSSVSAGVYSSSKKRSLMKFASPNGAGSHLAALQRSRLIPLPINIRTGTLNRDAFDRKPSNNNNGAERHSQAALGGLSVEQQMQDKANDDFAIASLKLRLAQMEKDAVKDLKHKHALEKQVSQLTKENQSVFSENQLLVSKIEHLEKNVLQQKHAFEKLSDRYASVYSNLQKLTEQQASSSPENHLGSVQSVLQALTKENQEFQRKLRVLEARHVEDKALAGNQEKKLKRLRAEMEALQHMNEANNRDDASEVHSEFSYKSPADLKQHLQAAPSPKLYGSTLANPQSTKNGSPTRTTAQAPTNSTGLSHGGGGSASHLIGAEEYQYIDPNILKVLEKVDSQFSITNAINLSVVLKKWLNCCLHVTCSTHIPTVLQLMLKRICELLHCEHAALFKVNHAERKLTGKYSETGDVHWELPLDKGIIGYAARMNALCNVQRAYDDPRFYSSTDTITGLPSRELLCIPLVHELQPGQPHSVFAVLQAWNTTHQKPFTANDQILGSLLTIQTGTVFLQTKVAKTLQKINGKLLQILRMPQEIVDDESASEGPSENSSLSFGIPSSMSAIHLVANAQTKFSECIGVKKLKIFVLDAEVMKIWHVGSEVDANGQLVLVRKYSNVLSSLCGLVLKSTSGFILDDPTSEATFNDTVDLKGGAGGMYLVPITSPWGSTPLGMIQVARSAKSSFHAVPGVDPGFTVAIAKEKQSAQASEDVLIMDLIDVFSRVFASLLHHVKAQQLYDTCPQEIQKARLAYLTDRLDCLESEYAKEQEEADEEEARLERTLAAAAMMEQRILESARTQSSQGRERTPLRVATPEILVVEKDTVRRASFAEAIVQPQTKSNLRDARRISSAGSSQKSVTFHPALGSLSTSDALYREGEQGEEEDEDTEQLDAADAEDERGSSDDVDQAESPSEDAITTGTESPTSVHQGSVVSVDEDVEQHVNDADGGDWRPDDRDEEQQLGDEAALNFTEVEQSFFDGEQDGGITGFDTDAYHMQSQDENTAWYEETRPDQDDGNDDMESDREQQLDQPGDDSSWLQEQQGDHNLDHGLNGSEIAQESDEPGLAHEVSDAYCHEEQEEVQLGEDGTASDWQEGGGYSDENVLWRGQDDNHFDVSSVGLISTDSMYAIDLSYSDGSSAEVTNPSGSDSFSPVDERADSEGVLDI